MATGTTSNRPTKDVADKALEKVTPVPEAIDVEGGGWRPTPGEILTGRIVDIRTGGTGRNSFGAYPILTMERANGSTVDVHAFHHTLKTRLREMRPKVGHTLTITYLGAQEQVERDNTPRYDREGKQMTLELYSVESPEFEYDWSSI